MQLDRALQRNSVVFFALFALLVLIGFWPTYFSNPTNLPTVLYHAHALTMTSWCAILVAQAYLIRTNRRDLHKRVGKLSFVVAPLVVITGIQLMRDVFRRVAFFEPIVYTQLFLFLGSVVVFVIFYVLAIHFRKTPALHSRYMVCTVFPIYPPATDRILSALFPEDPMSILIPSWFVAELVLLGLSIWDWQSPRRCKAFPAAFAIMLTYHVATFTVSQLPYWATFTDWFSR
jgi:hypothetical protein